METARKGGGVGGEILFQSWNSVIPFLPLKLIYKKILKKFKKLFYRDIQKQII